MKHEDKFNLVKYIYSLVDSRGKYQFWAMLSLTAVSSVIVAVSPLLLAKITDILTNSGATELYRTAFTSLATLSIMYMFTVIYSKVSAFIFVVLQSNLRINMLRLLSKRYFYDLYHSDIKSLNQNNAGFTTQKLNQASNDIYILVRNIAQNLLSPLIQLLSAITVVLVTHDFFSAIVFIIYVAAFIALNIGYSEKLAKLRKTSMDVTVQSYSILSDSVDNIIGAKKNNALALITERYDRTLDKEYDAQKKYWNFSASSLLINSFLAACLFGSIFFYNLYGVMNGTVTVGHFIMITSYIILLSTPVENIGALLSEIRQSLTSLSSFVGSITRQHAYDEPVAATVAPHFSDRVSVRISDLSFAYEDNQPVLKDINLVLPAGKMITLTGPSGSGKSTLAKLISGYYRNYTGTIFFNEYSLININDEELNSVVYHLTQDDYIFMDTLRFNLQIAGPDASEEEMHAVLTKANLSIINNQQVHLDTLLSNKGNNFSGGQKQRVSLARLFLRTPSIIIIDEATSALDYLNEAEILRTVRSQFPDALIINISHRANMLECSDYIYVLDNGKLCAEGSFNDLQRNDPYIRDLLLRPAE